MKTPGLTLGMNATTQEGIHINVINVHKGDDMFTLDVAELAGNSFGLLTIVYDHNKLM